MANVRRRGLALVLALVLALSLLPANVLANDEHVLESVEAEIGDELTLDPGVDAEEVDGFWYSSDEDVVLVDRHTGEIQVVGEGEAYVYFEYSEMEEREELIQQGEAVESPETPVVPGETETPDVEAGETETPDVEAGETETPDVEAGETETPDVEAGETETPDVEAGETETPDVEAGETETPDVEAGETETPDVEAGETETPDVEAGAVTMEALNTSFSNGPETRVVTFKIIATAPESGSVEEYLNLSSDYFGDAVFQNKWLEIVVVDEKGNELASETRAVHTDAGSLDNAEYYIDVTVLAQNGYQIVSCNPECDQYSNVRIKYGVGALTESNPKTRTLTVTVAENAATEYDVTFIWNVNYLGGENLSNKVYSTVTVSAEDPRLGADMPAEPVYYSQKFEGWNTRADGNGSWVDANTEITCDLTVYGQWSLSANASEYHVMGLDTDVAAYLRKQLELGQDDALDITRMDVRDTKGNSTEGHLGELMNRPESHDGQRYWNIQNKTIGLEAVLPEAISELTIQVNGTTVAIPADAFTMTRVETSGALGTPKVIIEIRLNEDVIPEPEPVTEPAEFYLLKEINRIPLENGSTQYAYEDYTGKDLVNMTGQVTGTAYADANGIIERGTIAGKDVQEVFADVNAHIQETPANAHLKMLKEQLLEEAGVEAGTYDDYQIVWYVVKTTSGTYHVDGAIYDTNDDYYTLTYDANADDASVKVPAGLVVKAGDTVDVSFDASRDGYTFQGWATEPNGEVVYTSNGTDTILMDSSKVLYAVWEKTEVQPSDVTITLSYDANAGDDAVTGMPAEQEETVKQGENAVFTIAAAEPTREGYTFQGWAGSADATAAEYQAGNTITVSVDTTLYAVWKQEEIVIPPQETVTLSFQYVTDVHDASRVPSGVTEPEDQDVESGSAFGSHGYGTGSYSSRYTFHGWYADAACTDRMSSDDVIEEDMTVYGYWTVQDRDDGGDDDDDDDDDDGTDIPDEDTPTTDLPDEDTPTTDLPDEGTPTTDLPEEDVPMAEAPETGDTMSAWVLAAGVSGLGLVWLAISSRKRGENEAE